MLEKSQKRKLRSDPSNNHSDVEVHDENLQLSCRSEISRTFQTRLKIRSPSGFRDAEFGQRQILRLIENLSSKVDNLSSSSSE